MNIKRILGVLFLVTIFIGTTASSCDTADKRQLTQPTQSYMSENVPNVIIIDPASTPMSQVPALVPGQQSSCVQVTPVDGTSGIGMFCSTPSAP